MSSYILVARRESDYKSVITYCIRLLLAMAVIAIAMALDAHAESCQMAHEMDPAVKQTLSSAAERDYQLIASNNAAAIAQNSIPDIANNMQGLTDLLNQNSADLAGSTATIRNVFILDASGTEPVLQNAQFYCGVFNPTSDNKIGFTLQNLPAGKYGLVIMEVQNAKSPYFYTFLLKQDGPGWRIAGLFPRNRQIAGHDAPWYWQQARDFKSRGEAYNAYFYYLIAREIAAPVPFIGTTKLDSFHEEVQQATPAQLPEQTPITVAGENGKTYQITSLFVVPDEKSKQLDLVMKYNAADISDSGKTFVENKEAMKALLAKLPELRQPFANLVARAVAPNGQDFGSMLPMKDLQ